MKSFILKLKIWAFENKKTFFVFVLVSAAILYGVFSLFNKSEEENKYVLSTVERGSIISSISGTGQVSASNQINISSKTSGDIVYLNAKVGQEVKSGTLIAQLNAKDALYDYETAKISYENLITIDDDDLYDVENAIVDAKNSLENTYINGRATLASVSIDTADLLANTEDIFNGYLSTTNNYNSSKTAKEYINRAEESYYTSVQNQNNFIKKYRVVSALTSKEEIEQMVKEAYEIAIDIAQTLKYSQDAVVYLRDREDNNMTKADEAYTSVTSLVNKANAIVTSITSTKNSITTNKRTLENAERRLKNLQEGPSVLSLRAEELSLRKKKEALTDYYIRAPFDGVIASVAVGRGESVNNGSTITTLITKQKVAEISLNEIDAAKVKVGQKVSLTFDAVEELTISGQVIEIDMVGTVNSGVVNYKIKIGFDINDDKIKPGMTVTANIITEMKQDVLAVSSSAVKTQGDMTYVEVFKGDTSSSQGNQTTGILLPNPPIRVEVEIGMSNDELIEIISGLVEGDRYVTRTISSSATTRSTASNSTPSILGGGAIRTGGGGGNFSR